jgi:secreted trypsin-like serine protease
LDISSLRAAKVRADNLQWPWMASLGHYIPNQNQNRNRKWVHKCGATLIDYQFVLTAAHCVQDGYLK